MTQNELMHYGVPGMKWGKRKTQTSNNYTARIARGHAGPGKYLTAKRQLAGDKKDLEYLNKGGHLSVGLTKKRQASYDKRDKAAIEKRIKKIEAKSENKLNKIARKDIKAENKYKSYKTAYDLSDSKAKQSLTPTQYGRWVTSGTKKAQKTRLNNLKKASDKATSKTKKYIDELSKNYNLTYDVTTGQYTLKSK